MPACDLGPPAARKFDIEAWMPARKRYGEISSCSSCTDYQSRRLKIVDEDNNNLHTVNGTACAVPRLMIALVETHQNSDGTVTIPQVLRPYMNDKTALKKPAMRFKHVWMKSLPDAVI
jgi:seryl-tRNA synthetase